VETEPLPKTGTADPLLAAAGVALVLGGLALKRFL
jgi:LPXTG-motif cell wall-anchored protein